MSAENLIYNCSGRAYWEKAYNEDRKQLCLYKWRTGEYVGDVVEEEVFDIKTGKYLGEIYKGRLVVDKSKAGKKKIKGNFMICTFGKMGRMRVPNLSKIEVPKGYEDFVVKDDE